MTAPSFFLAGNSKSGSTALYKMLQQHPDVFLPDPKEPNHFATDLCRASSGAFAPMSRDAYLALFEDAKPGQRCGEASACYLYSRTAAAEIARFDPEARVVVVLREPVSFLASYHRQLLLNPRSHGERVRDLGQAIALEPERRRGRRLPRGCEVPELLYYRERVRYVSQLERFDAVFPPEQLLVLVYDDFRLDNQGFAARVLEFLELPQRALEPVEINRGVALRSRAAHRVVHDVSVGRGGILTRTAKGITKRVVPPRARRAILHRTYARVVFDAPPPVPPQLEAELRAECTAEVELLSRRLDRDLVSEWGYG